MKYRLILPAVLAITLAGCTADQLATMQTDLDAFKKDAAATVEFFRPLVVSACKGASTAADVASEVMGDDSTVTSLATYVKAACDSAGAIDKLAANPTSLTWLGKLEGALKVIAKR